MHYKIIIMNVCNFLVNVLVSDNNELLPFGFIIVNQINNLVYSSFSKSSNMLKVYKNGAIAKFIDKQFNHFSPIQSSLEMS